MGAMYPIPCVVQEPPAVVFLLFLHKVGPRDQIGSSGSTFTC